jgi:AhpD family alkylhydroperoxidase
MKKNGKTSTHGRNSSWTAKAWPEGREAFQKFLSLALAEGELDARTKAFIQIACVSLLRCKHCIDGNVAKLKTEFKATDREIAEAMMVASAAAAATNLAWAREVFDERLG